MASISYRIFNNEKKDEYPSFSICFVGYFGQIFSQSHELFNANNVTRGSYRKYLKGSGKDYPAQFTTVEFDDVALDMFDGYLMWSQEYCVPQDVCDVCDLIPTVRSSYEICVS